MEATTTPPDIFCFGLNQVQLSRLAALIDGNLVATLDEPNLGESNTRTAVWFVGVAAANRFGTLIRQSAANPPDNTRPAAVIWVPDDEEAVAGYEAFCLSEFFAVQLKEGSAFDLKMMRAICQCSEYLRWPLRIGRLRDEYRLLEAANPGSTADELYPFTADEMEHLRGCRLCAIHAAATSGIAQESKLRALAGHDGYAVV